MKFEYISIDSYGKHGLILVGRNPVVGRKVFRIDDFYPYIYVASSEEIPESDKIAGLEMTDAVSIFGVPVKKLFVNDRAEVPWLRQKFKQSFEADIPFHKRAKIDMGIKSGFEVPDEKITDDKEIRISWKEVKGW
jgi:DNA polymerase elongation subunit (family B)